MRRYAALIHRIVSLAIAIAVVAGASVANGAFQFEFLVLGAVIGVAYWRWGPSWPPL